MSRDPYGATNTASAGFGGYLTTLSSLSSPTPATQIGASDHPTYGTSSFVDGSGPIFSMYLEMAAEEDKKMAEGWKADADGILIFVRHYLPVPCAVHRLISHWHRPVYSLLQSQR